jgi:hypothetical protein
MRKAFLHLPLVLVLSLALLPGVMSDPGSGGRPLTAGDTHVDQITVDLSTRSGINQYLRSLGVDPSEAVIQRGAHNYAGPNCPGGAWSCTEGVGVVVQLASHDDDDDDDDGDDDGDNLFVCSPEEDAVTANPDVDPGPNVFATCVIVQNSETGRNRAVCREHNEQEDGEVRQLCSILQINISGRNEATVDQLVVMEHDDTTQRSEQRSQIGQLNGTGSNRADVGQRSTLATESEEDEDADVLQEQDAIQESVVKQDSGVGVPVTAAAGDNRVNVFQFHRLEAEVEEASSVEQLQNANTPSLSECNETPNVCSLIDQDSSNGDQRIDVRQIQRHDAEAEDVELAFQKQGSSDFTGGLEAINHQDSTGVSRRSKAQDERQFADVEDAEGPACPPLPNMPCQLQFTGTGPKLNSNQQFNEDNFAFGAQNVLQLASDPTFQQATLDAVAGFVSGLPDGATFRQFVRQNDERAQQTVTGTGFVFARIDCQQGELPGEEEPTILQEEPCTVTGGEGGD